MKGQQQRKISAFFARKQEPSTKPAPPLASEIPSTEAAISAAEIAHARSAGLGKGVASDQQHNPNDEEDNEVEIVEHPAKRLRTTEAAAQSRTPFSFSPAAALKAAALAPATRVPPSMPPPRVPDPARAARAQHKLLLLGEISCGTDTSQAAAAALAVSAAAEAHLPRDPNAMGQQQQCAGDMATAGNGRKPAGAAEAAAAGAAAAKPPKLTPLEQQVVDLKKKHPGTLLMVEVCRGTCVYAYMHACMHERTVCTACMPSACEAACVNACMHAWLVGTACMHTA